MTLFAVMGIFNDLKIALFHREGPSQNPTSVFGPATATSNHSTTNNYNSSPWHVIAGTVLFFGCNWLWTRATGRRINSTIRVEDLAADLDIDDWERGGEDTAKTIINQLREIRSRLISVPVDTTVRSYLQKLLICYNRRLFGNDNLFVVVDLSLSANVQQFLSRYIQHLRMEEDRGGMYTSDGPVIQEFMHILRAQT